MKNAVFISFAIVLAFMPVFVSASAGMTFTLNTLEAKLCSCSTTQITGTLESGGYGAYTLTSNSKWVTIAPDTITLGPGESAPIYLYVTTDCNSPPKDYPIEISVKSDAGLTDTKQITATILPCHNVALSAIPADAKTCLEENAQFSLKVTNNGKADEDFLVSTSAGILETDKVTLLRNETKTIALEVPVNDTYKEVTLLVRSASTYAADSKTIKISGMNCHSADLGVSPEEKTVCLGDVANYSVSLKNTGTRRDDFTVNSSFGTLSDAYVSLEAGESKKITLLAQSYTPGNYPFYISAISRYVKAETSGTFKTAQCRGVEASIESREETLCKGLPITYSVSIKNIGSLDDTYLLTTNIGTLENGNVSVPKGESRTVKLSIPANALSDRNTITVKAVSIKDSGVISTASAALNTENCYKLNGTARKSEEKICAGETVTFFFDVQNTGKFEDEYSLSTTLGVISRERLVLSPEDRTTINITIPTDFSYSGKKNLTLSITSKNTNITQNLGLEIESAESCYGFKLAAKKDTLFTNDSEGKLFEINVDNTGKASSEFNATLDGPTWAYISPKEFVLQNEKNATIYVYSAPSYGTKDDAYLMKVTVKNDAGFAKTEFIQLVLGNATPLDLSKLRGTPTGEVVKSTTSQKSLYVIVLGILVIAIIIFGPGLFGKKKDEEETEVKEEFPEELIGTDKTVIMEPSEEKMPEDEEKKEDKKTEEKEEKEKSHENHEKKKHAKDKKHKAKSSKKDLQDILNNI